MLDQRSVAGRSIVLTTDCGVDMDDQWAIVHLSLIPEFDLRGIVTTHAPNLPAPAAQESARVTAGVLDMVSSAIRPPLFAGSDNPLAERAPIANAGVDFILEQSRAFGPDNRLVVLVLGAATDVGSALLADPGLGDRIEIVAMAFDGWPDGHDGFNVRNDIVAWQLILDSSARITCGDAASTIRHLALTVEQAERLFGDCGSLGRYLVELLDDWLVRNDWMAKDVTGDPASWPVWDEVVVAHLLGLTRWSTYPRPALKPGPEFDHAASPDAGRVIQWIEQIDHERLWNDLRTRLPKPGNEAFVGEWRVGSR
jgi:inosine-uridine nucleoside N-ribohydrolase